MKQRLAARIGFLITCAALANASITDEGVGVIYGSDHVFSLKAPKGWVLDNESAVAQGVHAVFYPKGNTWSDSVVVAYARARPVTAEVKTAADAAKLVVEDFRKNGSPKYEGKRVKTLKTSSGRDAVIYHYSGDQWGNSEAAAYFVEAKTINHIVLTSRDAKAFADALPAFEDLAASYVFLNDTGVVTHSEPSESFEEVYKKAQAQGETEAGKAYEKVFGAVFGKPMQTALMECVKGSEPPYTISMVFIIAADGAAERVLAAPGQKVSACVAEKMRGITLPAPPKEGWLVAVNLSIKE